ncbi:hypothetical protein GcM1_197016 [Golovinomyces cichoracearum]|uniref:Uncharacterized protein n=1 Tax=Golovinomyces cichoracearum TaxID=62708 RepID=A0A420IZS1_9PEZI|nr:hypothetical protein GcM1_197016 [Golovinomyces cichoracearum]
MDYSQESIIDVPVLAQDTHERWFRKMKIRLRAKGVDYVIEQSLRQYAALGGPDETYVSNITKGVSELSLEHNDHLRYDIDKKAKWEGDDATALSMMIKRLNEDDEALVDEYITTKSFWEYLKKKYSKTSPLTANENLTAIQTFGFSQYDSVTQAWDKLKQFRRKLGAASPDLKNAYTDQALLLVLTRSLPQEFVSTIDGIDVQTSMTVEEKLQHLRAKELRMKSTSEAAHASFKSYNKRSMSHHRRNDSSSSNATDINPGKCLLCDGIDYWIRRCPNLKSAREYVRRPRHKKKTHFVRSESPSSSKSRPSSIKRPSILKYSINNRHENKSYLLQEDAPNSE